MEEIYMNAEYDKFTNAKNCTGPRKYKSSFHTGVILCLGLLSFFLLIGLITLGIYFRDSARDVSAMSSKLSSMTEERDLLKANLSTTRNKLSSMTEERDLLQANLTVKTNELERLQDKTCPVGWSEFNHRCYLLSERSDSWDAARKNCTDEEADLLVINGPEEQTFLSTIINEYTWIGLNDKEQEGTWKWVDGTPPTLVHWASRQPDNGGDEDCACFRSHAANSWMDFPCSAGSVKKHQTLVQFCDKNTCSDGWSKFNCSCYIRSQSSGSWDAARKDCRDRGADLVVVDSPEEQIFLSTIATEITWIGLNEKEQEGIWKWVDGTPLTLSHWGWTEPNNGGEEDCAHVYSSEDMSMNDLSCSTSLKWICEKAPDYCIVS